jgi:putative transposase
VRLLCHTLNCHPSGYYQWLKQPTSHRQKQEQHFGAKIKQFWLESGGHYGYRNIYLDCQQAKTQCGRDRVLRLMRQLGLKAQRGYKTPKGYYSGKPDNVLPNKLQREFNVDSPNQWWVSDITYIHTQEGFLFLAVVMDLYAPNIVGWSMSDRITDDIVLNALTMAYWRRKPKHVVKFHSDQGSQYTSRHFKKLLLEFNIEPSMSRRGNCWDNAVAESFFSNLKKEKVRRTIFKTREEARQALFHYIEMFYNPKRRHTSNDRVSPNEYERQYFQKLKSV